MKKPNGGYGLKDCLDNLESLGLDPYKRPNKKSSKQAPSIDFVCAPKSEYIFIETLINERWIVVDWVTENQDILVETVIETLKSISPNDRFRATHQTTGRIVNF